MRVFLVATAILAPGITFFQFAPQAIRAYRTSRNGISLGTWAFFTSITASWLAYGFSQRVLPLILVNLATGPAAWAILARLGTIRALRSRVVLSFLAAPVSALLITIYPHVLVYVLSLTEVVALLPQLRGTYTTTDLAGVSVATWAITCLAQTLWGIYGLLAHQWALSMGGFLGALVALLIVRRLRIIENKVPQGPAVTV